ISLQASDQLAIASQILTKALELLPDDDRALVALGKVHVQMGDLDKAREVLDKGMELYPHNEEVLRGMAQILLRLDDLDSAMDMYSRILDQHPRDFEALLAKGEIHLRKGELSQSIKAYQAVNELDIHISWSGILKFIGSSLRSMMNRNENTLSYREDLKKEYENIILFLDRLDEKVTSASGSEPLGEMESLVKVLENLKLNLKEQVVKFEDLLAKFKVNDSFHQHLQGKVRDLKKNLSNYRLFDAKQIALELSPFLADLGNMGTKNDETVKEELRAKMDELKQIGIENRDLEIRLEEVDKLGREGNQEGAAFMLKEIEVSLEEYWIDASKRYHEERYTKMGELLEKAREQFDTSGLTEMFRSFEDLYEKGPKAVREGYQAFLQRYKEDSASFFRKESERLLKEIDLKITILEKDGINVSKLREESEDLMSELAESDTPKDLHGSVKELVEQVKQFQERQHVSMIRERLRGIDILLGQMDFLGMDDELAKNVEPVRRVIERSLKQQNTRLSEILTNELKDNIQKILKENYRSELGQLIHNTEGELLRLKGLGVEKKDWTVSINRSKSIQKGEEKGQMSEVVNSLSRIQTDIQTFMVKKLPDKIDDKLTECSELLGESSGYGFDMLKEETALDKLKVSAEEISSLDLLEDAYRFEGSIRRKIRSFLTRSVRERSEKVRQGVDGLTEFGVENTVLIDLISIINKADIQLENGKERDAWDLIVKAEDLYGDIRDRTLKEIKEGRMKEIDRLLEVSGLMGIGTDEIKKRRTDLLMKKDQDLEGDIKSSNAIVDDLFTMLKEGAMDRYEGYRETVREFLKETSGLVPEEMPGEMKAQIRDIKEALKNGSFEELPELFKAMDALLEKGLEKARERAYLDRCSNLVEIGLTIKDKRSNELVKKAQQLAERVRAGKMDDVDRDISSLQKEMSSLRSYIQMQDIENTLTEIKELDEMARDVFSTIEQDVPYKERFEPLNSRISKLLDRTASLYKDPDPELAKELTEEVNDLREEIMELEQEWRARRRLDTLSDMGLTDVNKKDGLLAEDIVNLSQQFEARDWNRFFRTWERVEGHVKKMENKGALPGGSLERIEGAAPASPGLEVLSRKKVV
ncbi:MAG: tetratricopeptide repeat protein, partial [Thermoplasmatota archaeon]